MSNIEQKDFGVETERDKQIEYIDNTMGKHKPGFDIITELQQRRYDGLLKNLDELLTDICERMDSRIEDDFFETYKDKCYDYIISTIDWEKLGQCDTCNKYYDYSDSDAERHNDFCSDLCEEDYEADDDRRDR